MANFEPYTKLTASALNAAFAEKLDAADKGEAGGVATLDEECKIPVEQLPDSVPTLDENGKLPESIIPWGGGGEGGGGGTVTSVGLSVPTGLQVSGSPVTGSGTIAISYQSGYSIPTDAKQSQWDTAYSWGNHASAGYLTSNAIGVTVQPYDSTILKSEDIGVSVGYANIPQVNKSEDYTTVLADSGKHILHPSADTNPRTFTIPSNEDVPYPVGTAITFVNQGGAGALTIDIDDDTLVLAGDGDTGPRTLDAPGVATALKIAANEWIISGVGLS